MDVSFEVNLFVHKSEVTIYSNITNSDLFNAVILTTAILTNRKPFTNKSQVLITNGGESGIHFFQDGVVFPCLKIGNTNEFL